MQRQAPLQQLAAKCEAEPQGAQGWRALEGGCKGGRWHPQGRDRDTGSRGISHHLTSPLWLLFALKPSS